MGREYTPEEQIKKSKDISLAEKQLLVAERALKNKKARDSLLDFIEVMNPDPDDPVNVNKSRYQCKRHHKLIIDMFEKFESGRNNFTALSIPPQHGKSFITTHHGPAWALGRSPHKNIIVGGYGSDFIQKFGSKVRTIFESRQFKQIFPEFELKKGSKAKDYMETTAGGSILFVGRGEGTTGNPCDLFIIDDPIKDKKEADSPTMREDLWDWYTSVAETRCHILSSIFVIHCMTGDTPVMMAGGGEKPLREVRVGDCVVSYKNGKLVSSKVLNWANQGRDCLFTIKMKSGISVRANARHPFLVHENGEEIWRRTDSIKKGMYIRRVIGGNGKGNNVSSTGVKSLHGVKECVTPTIQNNGGRMAIAHHLQTLKVGAKHIYGTGMALISKIMNVFSTNKKGCALYVDSTPRKKEITLFGTGSYWLTIVTGLEKLGGYCATNATFWSGMLRQRVFCWRQSNILKIVDDEVIEVTQEGLEDVFDIQVEDSENFIANGLVSHNTRWHEDDLIGRLCDPEHPEHDAELSEMWTYINVPAIVDDEVLSMALKIPMGSALWPERFPLELLERRRRQSPKVFSALYQGQPSPDDGDFFTKEMMQFYTPDQIPSRLRIYAASDHAVTEKEENDQSVLLIAGVDDSGNIYLLDCWFGRKKTDFVVERMIDLMDKWKPLFWWAGRDHITKSIGPFLKKRMAERKVYCMVSDQSETGDKQQKAQSIQGRMAMGKVYFPKKSHWVSHMIRELLRFPQATHDDFVDALAHLGRGINKMVNAGRGPANDEATGNGTPKSGTMAWVKWASKRQERQKKLRSIMGGM